MFALTLVQPWAELIVRGPKRGDRFDPEKAYAQSAVPYSAIVGVARLAGVERDAPGNDPWWFGPVGWRLADVVAIDPVPCSGAQGLWALSEATYQAVRAGWKAAHAGAVRA